MADNLYKYVGFRYVPKIMGAWDNTLDYEGLSIVTYEGTSYTSKNRVPVGIDINNTDYWVITGDFNAATDHKNYEADHARAEDDHLTASADHVQAVDDHAIVGGYNGRLTNVETGKANKAQEAWITPTLSNGWTENSTNYPVGYMKDTMGFVHLRGGIKNGTNNTVVFVLPSGYRPKTSLELSVAGGINTNAAYVVVSNNGKIIIKTAYTAWNNIDGVSFLAEW